MQFECAVQPATEGRRETGRRGEGEKGRKGCNQKVGLGIELLLTNSFHLSFVICYLLFAIWARTAVPFDEQQITNSKRQ
jgi:hypothetical protein